MSESAFPTRGVSRDPPGKRKTGGCADETDGRRPDSRADNKREKTSMNIQALMDALARAGELERSRYHVTLGALIEAIKGMPEDTPVVFDDSDKGPTGPRSYRGFYSDLAFEDESGAVTVGMLLHDCTGALGKTFEGYKGGDFTMHKDTPLWKADYGCCGRAIVDIRDDLGKLVLVTKEVD